jgi:hypothetical protein
MFTAERRVKRIWAQEVEADATLLQTRLDAIRATGNLTPSEEVLADGVAERLKAARAATTKVYPVPGKLSNWWRGTLVETSFHSMHTAEALSAGIYPAEVLWAEIPEATARVEANLERDDPRRASAEAMYDGRGVLIGAELTSQELAMWREQLRKTIEIGFSAADLGHTRLRNFRNAVVLATGVLIVLLVLFIGFVWTHPTDVSFCFEPEEGTLACPTGGSGPSRDDVLVIALLGMLGGLLSGIVSIKNLHGTSIAYDVPQALAALKLPLGALSAVGGMLLIRGQFVPGLSNLDSSDQILAYAFALGVAQQLLVGMVDRRAQDLIGSAPSKSTAVPRPERPRQASVGAGGPELVPDGATGAVVDLGVVKEQ